jgi:sarcosine oxidase subunit gamma
MRRTPIFVELGGRNANIRLPEIPNASVSSADISALWLGPREWLILTPRGLEPELQRSLRATLTNRSCAATDVTNGNTVMCLTGTRAQDVLAKGCSASICMILVSAPARVFRLTSQSWCAVVATG